MTGRKRTSKLAAVAALAALATLTTTGVAMAFDTAGTPNGGAPIVGGGLAPTGTTPSIPPPPSKHAHGRWLAGSRSPSTGRRRSRGSSAGWSPRPGCPACTGSTGCTRRPGSRWRARASGSTAACTTSTRSATAAGSPPTAADVAGRRLVGGRAVLARRGLLAQPAGAVTFPLAAGGWSDGPGAVMSRCADVTFAAGRLAAAALLPVDRRRSGRDPARQPGLRPRLPRRRTRRLVHRPGHRRRDQRPPHRRLPPAAAQPG